jgi:serine phosphatase RsbU (regulator of sigma subunit)
LVLHLDLAVAKSGKYATRESGDTAEIVERPGGGFSIVIVDAQGSGVGSKALSLALTSKAVGLLKDGVRDGAVARAVNDVLFTSRGGKVSASLDILSVDLPAERLIATRNSQVPLWMRSDVRCEFVAPVEGPIGHRRFTRPDVVQIPLEARAMMIAMTDGIHQAGKRATGELFPLETIAGDLDLNVSAQELAEIVLSNAFSREQGRPSDDMTVAVLKIVDSAAHDGIRRSTLWSALG